MNRRSRAAALAALSLALCLSLLAGLATPTARGQAPAGHADIVVDLGDGRMQVARVPVVSGTTGLSALEASGLDLELSGGAVCSIEGIGCPADNCFCACQSGEDCRFWGFHLGQPDGDWQAAEVGAGDQPLAPGQVHGWVWGRPAPAPAPANLRASLLATRWLLGFQEPSGGLADHVGFTAEAIFAARSAGIPLEAIRSEGDRSLVDYLAGAAGGYAETSAAAAGKALAGAVAANLDPRDVGGVNLVAQVQARYDAGSGWYGPTIWDQSWCILGLAAAGETIPDTARDALLGATSPAGGWGGIPAAETPDVDSSAMALQALAAAGLDAEHPDIDNALEWLASMRVWEGFAHDSPDGPANLNATGLALQALFSLGLDPSDRRWTGNFHYPSALEVLTETQQPDGRLQFGDEPSDVPDLLGTLQSVPGLTGRGLPISGYRVAALRGADWLLTQQEPDGGFGGNEYVVAMALAATGRDANPRSSEGRTLREEIVSWLPDEPDVNHDGWLALAYAATGGDPRTFPGADMSQRVLSDYDTASGRFGEGEPLDQALGILTLAASEVEIPDQAISATLASADPETGWGDPLDTGMVLQALAAGGLTADDPVVRTGIQYLLRIQGEGYWKEGEADGLAVVSSIALLGLQAMGQKIDGAGWMRPVSGTLGFETGRDAVLNVLQPDGSFPPGEDDLRVEYTAYAVLGLSGQPLPIFGQPAPTGPTPILLPFLLRDF